MPRTTWAPAVRRTGCLTDIRNDFPLSVHGVGLSIGGAGPLDRDHLARLKSLLDRYQPLMFSEHLAWSSHDGVFLNDLLPLPYNRRTFERVSSHINQVQDTLGVRMLLENPSTYVQFDSSDVPEVEFLRAVAKRTGCGLLLDVNNVHVSAINHGFDARAYIDAFPLAYVGEIHLAGFAEDSRCRGADAVDRCARLAGRRRGVGALPARTESRRTVADADRTGQRHSAVRGARRRGRAGEGGARGRGRAAHPVHRSVGGG